MTIEEIITDLTKKAEGVQRFKGILPKKGSQYQRLTGRYYALLECVQALSQVNDRDSVRKTLIDYNVWLDHSDSNTHVKACEENVDEYLNSK